MKKTSIIFSILLMLNCNVDPDAPEESLILEDIIDDTRTSVTQNTQNTSTGSGNTCTDRDNDNFCDEEDDYWPWDPEMNKNLWGIINDSEPNFYFTYDVDDVVEEATINSMLGAMEEFGNWGPIELWVVGQDIEGVSPWAKMFCDIRVRRGQTFFPNFTTLACVEFMLYPLAGENYLPIDLVLTDERLKSQGGYFSYYMNKSIESTENNYPTGDGKGLNGRRD